MFFNSLSLVALNFEHDIESVVEIQKGVALACDLEILTEEMKKFFDQNQEYVNQQFLHYSYDDNIDGIVQKLFKVSEVR
jgi:hypothetical protein